MKVSLLWSWFCLNSAREIENRNMDKSEERSIQNMAPWMQSSIGIVQMKYVAVTVLLVSDSLPEAEDPWRVFPTISLSDTQNCDWNWQNSPEGNLFIFGIIRLVLCVMWHRVVLWAFSDDSEEPCSSILRKEGVILCEHKNCVNGGRVQLKRDGTRWRKEGKWRGNWRMEWVASTLPYHGTWCIQHYYRWCAHLGCR